MHRWRLLAGLAAGILLAGTLAWWLWGRTPQRQVLAAQAGFLEAVEDRDWREVRDWLAPAYADDYGHDRDTAVEAAEQALAGFVFLTVQSELAQIQAVPDLAMVRLRVRLEGQGLGVSPLVLARVNALQEPWFFHWQKLGPWPWSWRIVQIHHNELQLPPAP